MLTTDNQPILVERLRRFCKSGHPLTIGNPNVRTRKDGRRICRTCAQARDAKRYQLALQRKLAQSADPAPLANS